MIFRQLPTSLNHHTAPIRSILYYDDDDEKTLISCSDDCSIKFWRFPTNNDEGNEDTAPLKLLKTYHFPQSFGFNSLTYSKSTKTVFVSSLSGDIYILSSNQNQVITLNQAAINLLSHPTKPLLVIVSKTLEIYDINEIDSTKFKPLSTYSLDNGCFTSIVFHPNRPEILACHPFEIKIFDFSFKEIKTLKLSIEIPQCAFFIDNLLFVGFPNSVRAYDSNHYEPLWMIKTPVKSVVAQFISDRIENLLQPYQIVTCSTDTITLFDSRTREVLHSAEMRSLVNVKHRGYITTSLIFDSTGKYLIFGDADGFIRIVQTK